jgi:hypothetical protein
MASRSFPVEETLILEVPLELARWPSLDSLIVQRMLIYVNGGPDLGVDFHLQPIPQYRLNSGARRRNPRKELCICVVEVIEVLRLITMSVCKSCDAWPLTYSHPSQMIAAEYASDLQFCLEA